MTEYIVDFGNSMAMLSRIIESPSAWLCGEIVRCRDCEYFDTRKCKSQWPFCLDAFCWWGKRKEGDE